MLAIIMIAQEKRKVNSFAQIASNDDEGNKKHDKSKQKVRLYEHFSATIQNVNGRAQNIARRYRGDLRRKTSIRVAMVERRNAPGYIVINEYSAIFQR